MSKTVDFCAPDDILAHRFYMVIPSTSQGRVELWESLGLIGDRDGRSRPEKRVELSRAVWNDCRAAVAEEFNDRLKAQKQGQGHWHTGTVYLERMLGRELCVLLWALEDSTKEQRSDILAYWRSLRPEERLWLYLRTAAKNADADAGKRGWRRALTLAFADADTRADKTSRAKFSKKSSVDQSEMPSLPLFSN